jgi:hypothetical protein
MRRCASAFRHRARVDDARCQMMQFWPSSPYSPAFLSYVGYRFEATLAAIYASVCAGCRASCTRLDAPCGGSVQLSLSSRRAALPPTAYLRAADS